MRQLPHLDWPFFEQRYGAFATALDGWAGQHVAGIHGPDVDAACRQLVRTLGEGGWLRHAVGGSHGEREVIDTRAICLARETLAYHNGLADFAFAMQGLGSGAISLQGTPEQKERYLARVARGEAIGTIVSKEG